MRRSWFVASLAAVAFTASTATGMFADPPAAPVLRLLANAKRALEKAPDDPHLLYLVGRTHAVAYAQGMDATCRTSGFGRKADTEDGLPRFGTRSYDLLEFKGEADPDRLAHLQDGIRHLRAAAALAKAPEQAHPKPEKSGSAGDKDAGAGDEEKRAWTAEEIEELRRRGPDDRAMIHLGLAWLLDDGSRFASKLGHPENPAPKAELSETDAAAIDARIEALGAKDDTERSKAYADLRTSFARCWPRLVDAKDHKDEIVRKAVSSLLDRWWKDQALDQYRQAFALTKDNDLKATKFDGIYRIAREAGAAIVRLLDASAGVTEAERVAIDKERESVAKDLLQAPNGFAITPVIFPISAPRPMGDLLPPGRTARFDLAGDGIQRLWPWPSADAGFLVWTPAPDAPVTSGRNLIGERTWWIFWRDGYEPLSMLDDDGDGRLRGAELEGLGVWCDADGDGVSDPGEVQPVAERKIEWIAVRATRLEDGVPAADLGIGFADGSTRPTYDWTPHSLPEPRPQQ